MAHDGVANFVNRLRECRFDPRRIGADTWESQGFSDTHNLLDRTRGFVNALVLWRIPGLGVLAKPENLGV